MKNLALFILLFACAACSKGSDEPENPSLYIILEESELNTGFSGEKRRIEVVSDCDWSVGETPEWCVARKVVVGSEEYLDVEIEPNDAQTPRRATVLLSWERTVAALSVSQGGKVQVDPLQWYSLPVNFFTGVKYQLGKDKVTRNYQITGISTFAVPSFGKQIFTGNAINRVTDNEKLTDYYNDYTFNPITISSILGKSMELAKPSFEGMNELVQEVIRDLPPQSQAFSISTPVQYNSYRHLHLLGQGNMGLELDELISGKSYSEQEMERKTGLIYNYSFTLFSVVMDYPANGKLIKETIKPEALSKMSYINSVTYGKTALLLAESDSGYDAVKGVIGKISRGESLTDEEQTVKNSLTLWYIYFDKDGEQVVKGGDELIKRYLDEMKQTTTGIVPLSFTTNELEDNSVGQIQVVFDLL